MNHILIGWSKATTTSLVIIICWSIQRTYYTVCTKSNLSILNQIGQTTYIYITNSNFDPIQVLTIDIEMPPNGKFLRISIEEYSIFNILYIYQVYNDWPLFVQIP